MTFGWIGDIAPATPIPVSSFLRRRCGTRTPSSRHNLRIRLLLTVQLPNMPSWRPGATPNEDDQCRTGAATPQLNLLGGARRGVSRVVDRCQPTRTHAGRSDTPNRSRSAITALLWHAKRILQVVDDPFRGVSASGVNRIFEQPGMARLPFTQHSRVKMP